jgi:hypothetical protein
MAEAKMVGSKGTGVKLMASHCGELCEVIRTVSSASLFAVDSCSWHEQISSEQGRIGCDRIRVLNELI